MWKPKRLSTTFRVPDSNKSTLILATWQSAASLSHVNIQVIHALVIMNKKAHLAWQLYLEMETSSESFLLLHLIADDSYLVWLKFCLVIPYELDWSVFVVGQGFRCAGEDRPYAGLLGREA
jgi:hypothetical protein